MLKVSAAVVLSSLGVLAGCSSGPQAGEAAPAFSAMNSEGQNVELASYAGKVTVLDFWATWCPPCRRAMPHVQDLHERYEDNPNVAVVGVHFDTNYRAGNPADYFDEKGYTFDMIPDGSAISELYGISSLPSFVVIDESGTIIHRQRGFGASDVDAFAEIIDAQLAKNAG
ncbi:MAG: TlpA disulfide reductase family protein [Planctomycetota bacterium]